MVQMVSELVAGNVTPVFENCLDSRLQARANVWLVPQRLYVRRLGLVVGIDGQSERKWIVK